MRLPYVLFCTGEKKEEKATRGENAFTSTLVKKELGMGDIVLG